MSKEKLHYEEPVVDIITLGEDVITTSSYDGGDGYFEIEFY